jgi:hypothetical protein
MARVKPHKCTDNWLADLDADMTAEETSCILSDSGSAGLEVPCMVNCEAEIMEVTQIEVDVPSVGKDTLTVVRGQWNTAGAIHLTGAVVQQLAYAGQVTELQDKIAALETMLMQMLGGAGDGIPGTSGYPELKVVAQSTPDMTVKVQAGAGLVDDQPACLETAFDTEAFVAPTVNDRIDLVELDQDGEVMVKEGTEGSPPTPPSGDADTMTLAEVYLRSGMTCIKDTDDASNGYITDKRTFR